MESLLEQLPYLGVVTVLLLGGMGIPIPEDVPLLFSGYLCHLGEADIRIMLPLAFSAVIAGDSIMFSLGAKYGNRIFRLSFLRKILTEDHLASAAKAFKRYGGRTLFVARFLPGIRACVFFSAGALHLPYWKLLAYDGTAALISVPALVLATYYGGDKIDEFRRMAADFRIGFVLILLVVGLVFWKRRKKAKEAEAAAAAKVTQPDEGGA